MAKDTLTLALNGDVSLEDFSKAIQQFSNLVSSLHDDVAKESSIEWFIENLEAGSAIATVKGIGEEESDAQAIEQVVDAYCNDSTKVLSCQECLGANPEQVRARRRAPYPHSPAS